MILFMDDDPGRAAKAWEWMSPKRRNQTMWCTTAQEAISVLDDQGYRDALTEVHLDHDLGGTSFQDPTEKNCGMEVIRFIEKFPPSIFSDILFIIHTWNGAAGCEMRNRLRHLGLKVFYRPFGKEKI